MAKHALLSASGASRWLECPPSAKLELQFPKRQSDYADEGTAAHELCELAARYWLGVIDEMTYENALARLATGRFYSAEMLECAADYGAFINETLKATRTNCPDAFAELEVWGLDFSEWVPGGHGTGNCIIVADDLLEIIDFKYGKGVRVEADGNAQMRLYALGALQRYSALYDITRVKMSIIQPRVNREPKLLSPPAMEKAFGKKAVDPLFKGLVCKPQVKPTLARAKDKRPEFMPEDFVLDAFDDDEE